MTCRPTDLTGQGDSGGGDGVAVPARGSRPVGSYPTPQTRRGAALLPLRHRRRPRAHPAGTHQVPKLHRDDADTGALDTAQARRLWEATAGRPRTRALVAVLLFCGLRIGEALTLHTADLDTQQGATVLRVTGKGAKPRTAVLPAPAVVAIHDWLEQRGDSPGSLFATRTGAAMDPRVAHRLIGRIGDRAGIAQLHPHTLRHTFATSAVNAGADVLKIATALGHASPSTTMRYVRGRDVITHSPVHAVAAAIVNG